MDLSSHQTNLDRVPAGIPAGGEFTTSTRDENDDLDDTPLCFVGREPDGTCEVCGEPGFTCFDPYLHDLFDEDVARVLCAYDYTDLARNI